VIQAILITPPLDPSLLIANATPKTDNIQVMQH
jgi:hypothetical protein